MSGLMYTLAAEEKLSADLLDGAHWQAGQLEMRNFPDGESYVRVLDEVKGREVAILCQLHRPDTRVLPLLLLADTLHDLGAKRVGLVAPYLSYMRQDKRFREGEGVSAQYFARLLSQHLDWLIAVDPHLHRIHSLDEVYSIPARALTAVEPIASWLRENVSKPLVIGPDSESEQWAARVAEAAGCPWEVLSKQRFGDRDVRVSLPHVEQYQDRTPVLVDDIISTGRTMLQAAAHLHEAGLQGTVCIGVHGIFAPGARAEMEAAGVRVVTSNSIPDESNAIDLAPLIREALVGMVP